MARAWRLTRQPPEGLSYVPDFLSIPDERALIAEIERLTFVPVVMRGVTAKRTVVHYGWHYDYGSFKVSPAPPVPEVLRPMHGRASDLSGIAREALQQVIVARYPTGAGIGWHCDAPAFGPTVVGISLGSDALMRFKRKVGDGNEIFRIAFAARSAYVIGGAARSVWQHSLAPTRALRYSITFRTLSRRAIVEAPTAERAGR